jgi:stage V sporulation protein T
MKEIGIVRRIDELGRIVIPIEIRRTMRVKSGDEMELFINENGDISLSKYSQIKSIEDLIKSYLKTLYSHYNIPIVVTNKSSVIATVGNAVSELSDGFLSVMLDKKINERKSVILNKEEVIALVAGDRLNYVNQAIVIINIGGDTYGSVIIPSFDRKLNEADLAIAETLSLIISSNLQ